MLQGVPVIDYDRLTLGGGAVVLRVLRQRRGRHRHRRGPGQVHAGQRHEDGPVALLNGSPTDNNATLFKEGYEKAIKDAGYNIAADQTCPTGTTPRPARSSSRCTPRPTVTSSASRQPTTVWVAR